MLILTRQAGEKIKIGDDIEIVILKSNPRSSYIKVGIVAPRGVAVHREEIYNKINNIKPVFTKRKTEITEKCVKVFYKARRYFDES